MNLILCLAAGGAITGLNLAGWSWVVGRMGKPLGRGRLALFLAFFFLKLGLSALALYFILMAPWCSIPGLLVGLGLPAMGLALRRLFSLHRLPKD